MFAIKCCEILNNIYVGTIKFITFVLETHISILNNKRHEISRCYKADFLH